MSTGPQGRPGSSGKGRVPIKHAFSRFSTLSVSFLNGGMEQDFMIHIDYQTILILMLVTFIAGLMVGASLVRPGRVR